jgi:hypothetical protein
MWSSLMSKVVVCRVARVHLHSSWSGPGSHPLAHDAGAASSSSTRVDELHVLLQAEQQKRARGASTSPGPPRQKAAREDDNRANRVVETDKEKVTRTTSVEYAQALFVGGRIAPTSKHLEQHPTCRCKQPPKEPGDEERPCYENLWSSWQEAQKHMRGVMGKGQELRTQFVFEQLRHAFYPGATGREEWHYLIKGRRVCKEYFSWANGIGVSTLESQQARVQAGCTKAHAKHEEGSHKESGTSKTDPKRLSVIAWWLAYSEEVGDYMPYADEVIIPLRPRKEEFGEYAGGRGEGECASKTYFGETFQSAPELTRIRHARTCFNFQHCRHCVNNNARMQGAVASGNPVSIAQAKETRTAHHLDQRLERQAYYERREHAMRHPSRAVSIILDKWDSSKSTCPYFRRATATWKEDKKMALRLHVLGVMVHATPNHEVYLYTFNDSVAGDANSNIEGLRRTLATKYAKEPMPRCLYVQADSAGDNRNWAVFLFLAMLVYHNYTVEVYFSFLLVGHTHEDIDQLFSVISRYFRSGIPESEAKTPQSFEQCMRECLESRFNVHLAQMLSVLDWSYSLSPSLIAGIGGIRHRILELEDGTDGRRTVHTFRIQRRSSDGIVVFHYKERCAHAVWLPPIDPDAKPLRTDPNGIEIFKRDWPPLDPMTTTPREVELHCAPCTPCTG